MAPEIIRPEPGAGCATDIQIMALTALSGTVFLKLSFGRKAALAIGFERDFC